MSAEAAHAVSAHAAEAASHASEAIPELPNIVTALTHGFRDAAWARQLHHWENLLFSVVVGLALSWIAWRYSRRPTLIPRGWQNLLEVLVQGIDQFVQHIIGPCGRRFTPFIGTLFLYIWVMKLAG